MGTPTGFVWTHRSNGEVEIRHQGRVAAILRGAKAQRFLTQAVDGDEQELMARVTGNYRRGNERVARNHPRNR